VVKYFATTPAYFEQVFITHTSEAGKINFSERVENKLATLLY